MGPRYDNPGAVDLGQTWVGKKGGRVGKWGKLCGEKRLTNDAEVEVVAHLGLGPNLALVPPGVAQPDRSERERRQREE